MLSPNRVPLARRSIRLETLTMFLLTYTLFSLLWDSVLFSAPESSEAALQQENRNRITHEFPLYSFKGPGLRLHEAGSQRHHHHLAEKPLSLAEPLGQTDDNKDTSQSGSPIQLEQGVGGMDVLVFPPNVSGVYSAEWQKVNATGEGEISKDLHMHASQGQLTFRLNTWRSAVTTETSLLVEGSVAITDGDSATSRDFQSNIHGFYFPDSGKLIGYAKSPGGMLNVDDREKAQPHPAASVVGSGSGSDEASASDQAVLSDTHTSPSLIETQEEANKITKLLRAKSHKEGLQLLQELHSSPNAPQSGPPVVLSSRSSCSMSVEMDFEGISSSWIDNKGQIKQDVFHELKVFGLIHSSSCNIHLQFVGNSIDEVGILEKMRHYAAIMAMVSIVQLILLYNQMVDSTAPARALKLSMASVGMTCFIDAYLCSLHMIEGMMTEALMQQFIICSLVELVSFALIGMRLLLFIWKARRPDAFANGWENMRREFSVLYTRFYLCIFTGILLMFQLQAYMYIIVFFVYSFWLPQIIHNVWADSNRGLKPAFIVGSTVCRLFLPMYMLGCPVNFFSLYQFQEMRPNLTAAMCLAGWVVLQAVVLFVQDTFGPRCFIPKQFLPPKFDYHELTGIDRDVEMGEDSPCPICYSEFDIDCPATEIMRTPCNHLYHTECLLRWMEQKMECPACRQPLPSV